MAMKSKAFILKHSSPDLLRVITPYNANFIEELKASIDFAGRRWDPLLKCWLVNRVYLEDLVAILKRHYSEIETDLLGTNDRSSSNPFYPVFALIDKPKQASKVYATLATVFHPDVGGNDERMKELNQAYDATKKRLEKIAPAGEQQ